VYYTLRLILLLFACLFTAHLSFAEMRTVTATGEYRMAGIDSRADAKQLALQDAKRLALDKVTAYVGGLTEVPNLTLTRDELSAYVAGLIEIAELATRTTVEGGTTLVRADVTTRIDSDRVTRQIATVHQSDSVRAELLSLKEEADRLRKAVSAKTAELASRTSKSDAQAIIEERQRLLTKLDVNGLVTRARATLGATEDGGPAAESATAEARAHAKSLLDQALSLDPRNVKAHALMGTVLFLEKDFDEALRAYRTALRLDPSEAKGHIGAAAVLGKRGNADASTKELQSAIQLQSTNAMAHYNLGVALHRRGNAKGAAQEYREFLKLIRDIPVNQPLIAAARSSLHDAERQSARGCATTAQAGTFSSTSDVGSVDFGLVVLPLIALAVYVIRFRRRRKDGFVFHSPPPS
jgi:tetratricopeptide (TPR) repeat protein